MASLLKIADLLDIIPRKAGKIAGWVVLPLVAVIMFDVVTRKIDFFRIGMSQLSFYWLIEPIKLQDLQWHFHAIVLLLSFGFAYLMNAHVRVDIFREMLPKRKQAWVEFWGLLLLGIPYLILITYFAIIFVTISFQQGEGSESLTGIPMRYIIKSFTVVGFALLLMAFLATIMRLWIYLHGSPWESLQAEKSLAIFAEQIKPPSSVEELEKKAHELEEQR